ncbi:MAG: acyl-CoA thioesterase [Gammaproteobacteria bacterium]|nr:acyl-CoA thioesterase [Gammaproteobacteria bacterium]
MVTTKSILPEGKIPVLRVPCMPSDANQGGSIFGGWIMSQVDVAGSIPASLHAKGYVVTRAVDSFEFKKPVLIGDLLSCYADVVSTGRTSVSIKVDVYAERSRQGVVQCIHVTEANLVYVAIDEHGRPRKIETEK